MTTTALDTADTVDHRTATRTGIAATGLAIFGLASTYLLPALLDDQELVNLPGFLVGTTVTLLLAVVLFGKVVPRALRAPAGTNRPARTGLVTSLFSFVSIAIFWLGAPLVVAGAAFVLGRRGRERGTQDGGRGRATAAVAISVVVVVVTMAVLVNDMLGYVGRGIQPPE